MKQMFREELLSPQFKEQQDQECSTEECRKFSSVSAKEFNTPETKDRSSQIQNKMLSRDTLNLHWRNKTATFEDEQNTLYQEIFELYKKQQFDHAELKEPNIIFKTNDTPKRITIKRSIQTKGSKFNNQELIDKMHQYKKNSYQILKNQHILNEF